jgi:integrase
VRRYAAERLAAGAANATVNRELAALKRMFTLATRAERLSSAPHIALLEEANARQGFVDPGDFDRLLDALPDELKDPIGFLYLSGWRVSEMRALEWRDIDLTAKVVRLRPELAKNKTARLLPLHGELLAILGRAREARRPDCRFVFHRQGIPIGEFRKSWAAACRAAGLSGLLVHDLRRSAVRNLVRAGVPERVAMALSGHKTRSIFDRYAIVRESDLAEAAEKLHAHIARSRSASVVPMTAVAGRP